MNMVYVNCPYQPKSIYIGGQKHELEDIASMCAHAHKKKQKQKVNEMATGNAQVEDLLEQERAQLQREVFDITSPSGEIIDTALRFRTAYARKVEIAAQLKLPLSELRIVQRLVAADEAKALRGVRGISEEGITLREKRLVNAIRKAQKSISILAAAKRDVSSYKIEGFDALLAKYPAVPVKRDDVKSEKKGNKKK